MKKEFLIILMIGFLPVIKAQKLEKNNISYKIKSKEVIISYEKYSNNVELKGLKKSNAKFPIYVLTGNNIEKIKYMANLIGALDKQREVLKNSKEATSALRNEYENIIQTQENRVQIYKQSYEQLVSINNNLNEQLDMAIESGKKAAFRSKLNGTIYGVLGGLLTGLTLSIILSQ